MESPVRIGIIGTGFAKATQIPAFRACPNARITALASGRAGRAADTAAEFGIPFHTGDWRELVARDDVDLVSIATPPVLHREMVLAALAAGKHVLCEKPTAMNATESDEMRRAARESGLLAVIDHELRFLDCRRKMREMIHAGEIGVIHHAAVTERRDSRSDPARGWNWWSDEEQGGGELGALGSHAFDALLWLLDADVTSLCGLLSAHVPERRDPVCGEMRRVTADDAARVLVRFADGPFTAGATGIVSLAAVDSGAQEHRVEIFGTTGALSVDREGRLLRSERGSGRWTEVPTAHERPAAGMADTEWTRGFTLLSRSLVDAVGRGLATLEGAATFEEGHRTQLVLDAVRLSHREERWVSLV